jgi:hypothetical protein
MTLLKFVPLGCCAASFFAPVGVLPDAGTSVRLASTNNAIGDREETRGLALSSADAAGDAPFITSAMSSGAVAATSHFNLPELTVAHAMSVGKPAMADPGSPEAASVLAGFPPPSPRPLCPILVRRGCPKRAPSSFLCPC